MRTLTFFTSALLLASMQVAAQSTSDLIFFTEDGQTFTLVVDGKRYNQEPASRVVVRDVRNETPVIRVDFTDATIPDVSKPGYFPLGMEYTVMIKQNKKGEYVLRPSGEAPLGTTAATPAPDPTGFVEDVEAVQQATPAGVQQSVTIMEETTTGEELGSDKVNISIGIDGMNMNMDVQVEDGEENTQIRTTTTTTTTGSGRPQVREQQMERPTIQTAEPAPAVPGYSGPIGCDMPMGVKEFAMAKQSISNKDLDDTRRTLAKQAIRDRCITVAQVKEVLGLFQFEDSKLDFAKFAYDHTYDLGNYYQVNDAFTFDSTIDELNEFLQSR